jgi:hypothetical protein
MSTPSNPSKLDDDYTKLYDYVLTLHQEIKLVWFTPWNLIKFLFFLVRYMPFGVMYITISGLSFCAHLAYAAASEIWNITVQLFLNMTTEACRMMWPALGSE